MALSHRGHNVCIDECGLTIGGDLTVLLWKAYGYAQYLHVNDMQFDSSHRLLIGIMHRMLQCSDQRDPGNGLCADHVRLEEIEYERLEHQG